MTETSPRGLSMGAYLERRLGPTPYRMQCYRVLVAPFLAASFSQFWAGWNPVWAYWLSRSVYRPLRRIWPRPPAMIATFAVSGVVHNVIAVGVTQRLSLFTTLFFCAVGVVGVGSEVLDVRWDALPRPLRPPLILGHLYLTFHVCSVLVAP